MEYKQLFDNVRDTLQHGHPFSIQVETWQRAHDEPETRWSIYVPFSGGESVHAEGRTAEDAWKKYDAEMSDEVECLAATSASVAMAEVGS